MENNGDQVLAEELAELRRRVSELEAAEQQGQRAREELQRERQRFQTLVEEAPLGVAIIANDGRYQYLNPEFVTLFGYTLQDIPTGREWFTKAYPDRRYRDEAVSAWIGDLKESGRGQARPRTFAVACKDGSEKLIRFRAVIVDDGSQFVICEDVTQQKRAEHAILQLAYHDPLTGLPNRALFNDQLAVGLAKARRNRLPLAVMLLDLDQFKEVNDSLGRVVADQLLKAVAARLTSLLREADMVCRVGGDEFLLLLPEMVRPEDAATVAERVLEAIRKPFLLNGFELHITTSIGIAVYPHDGQDGDALIRQAGIALYRAKEAGGDNHQRSAPLRVTKTILDSRKDPAGG